MGGYPLGWRHLQAKARSRLPRFAADYIDGGSGEESALRRNISDRENRLLLPRPLRAGSTVKTGTSLFNIKYAMPVGIAPLGLTDLIHPSGDFILAKAALRHEIPFIQSSASFTSPRSIAGQLGFAPGHQLYVWDPIALEARIDELDRLGCALIAVTIDVPVGGVRWRERRHSISLKPNIAMVRQALLRPRWLAGHCKAYLDGSTAHFSSLPDAVIERRFDTAMTWQTIARLRDRWAGRLVIKGILHPEDAAAAKEIGCDGIIVSNHGGRQLDSAPTIWSMLPQIRSAVGKSFPVIADSGVRNGEDVIRAIALGADFTLIGRLALWALAAGGTRQLDATLTDLREQCAIAMQLIGCSDVSKIGPELITSGQSDE